MEPTKMQEKSLQGNLQGVVEDDNWSTKRSVTVCSQARLISGNPCLEKR